MRDQLLICCCISMLILLLWLCPAARGADPHASSSPVTLTQVRRDCNSLLEASIRIGVTREFRRGFKLFSNEPKQYKKRMGLLDAVAERLAHHSKMLRDEEWSCSSRKDFDRMFDRYFYEPCKHLKSINSNISDQYKTEVTKERYESIINICNDVLKPNRRSATYKKFKKELKIHNSRDCTE